MTGESHDTTVFERVSELVKRGQPAALLTVVGKDGSAPREVGARMVVTERDAFGTIGGGTVEALAIAAGRAVLAGEEEPAVRSYELETGGNTGMVCGGTMDVFVDRVRGQPRLYIAGGGHIAQELAPLASRVGYTVTVIDDREEYADPDAFPGEVTVIHGRYGKALSRLSMTRETALAVATRSGTFDQEAVAAGIDGGAGYIGVVASERKATHIIESLVDDGYARVDLVRVRTPVGYDLGGGGPADVALSIISEVHAWRHGASAEPTTRLDLDDLVVVRGGGDLGSGVVYRLHRAGYPVVVTDVDEPTVVRREVAFASAIYDERIDVEGVVGRWAEDLDAACAILLEGDVPVIADAEAAIAEELGAGVLVDAIMAKGSRDTGTRRDDAPVVIGLGPGFEAGNDVDAVVETSRGHELGRVSYEGGVREYDGEPAPRAGYTTERVFRAPIDGRWEPEVEIGDLVDSGTVLGAVGEQSVVAEIDGLVRGLVRGGLDVSSGTKLGDIDPRGETVDHTKVSDKALCLGGGVLEAVLRLR